MRSRTPWNPAHDYVQDFRNLVTNTRLLREGHDMFLLWVRSLVQVRSTGGGGTPPLTTLGSSALSGLVGTAPLLGHYQVDWWGLPTVSDIITRIGRDYSLRPYQVDWSGLRPRGCVREALIISVSS